MKLNINISKILFIILFYSLSSNAQLNSFLIDGEGWAKGNYIEFGINEKGVYGASTDNLPSTFHSNRTPGLFGFLANPAADDWVDYDGDYFTPGIPEEGFSLQINGVNYSNNNVSDLFQIPGEVKDSSILTSDCFDNVAQIIWEGSVSGLAIKRYYSVTEDGLFIQMITTIKNTSFETKKDVYFMHNVDPDNNQSINGQFETDQNLISQASSVEDDICLVTASQNGNSEILIDPTGSNVSFFSKSPLARVSFGGFANRNPSDVWNSIGLIGVEGSTSGNSDEAISIAFNLGDLTENQEVNFVYYYILEEIDENFIPIIVNVTPTNPSTCNGTDGSIVISGLISDENYIISYEDDGEIVPDQNYIADSNGIIEIINLNSGIYTKINIEWDACSASLTTMYQLTDPIVPDFSISKTDITKCFKEDGTISFSALLSDTNYNISYELNGNLVNENYLSDDVGSVTISDLREGTYSNFTAETSNCYVAVDDIVNLFEPEKPIANEIIDQFYCDEDYDYITTINLSDLNSIVLGGQEPNDFQITYHVTEEDVFDNVAISNTYETPGLSSFVLYSKIKNIHTDCYAYVLFNVQIGTPAEFDLKEDFICINSDDNVDSNYETPIIETFLSPLLYSFEWYHDEILLPFENSANLIVNDFGEYSVKVTQLSSGCHVTKSTIIYPSGIPNYFDVTITSLPFSTTHTVEILTRGYGNYEYKMDDGNYQSSPLFSNILPGHHIFYINDLNGCGLVLEEIDIIDYPKFFTPNGDGINDYWQIIGIQELKYPKIYIFDRYGKLIKNLSSSDIGWNGNYNGNLLPSSDYWFKVVFKDSNNIERVFSAHFSLKR